VRVRIDRSRAGADVSVDWSLEELYRHLHTIGRDFDSEVEQQLRVVFHSLRDA